MASIAQIEASIQTLPAKEFFTLLGWMSEHHLKILSSDDFEALELETELLKSLDSPRHVVDDGLFDDIRALAAN
jgi:hypothetical protein